MRKTTKNLTLERNYTLPAGISIKQSGNQSIGRQLKGHCQSGGDSCNYGRIEPDRPGNFPAKAAFGKCGCPVNEDDVKGHRTITPDRNRTSSAQKNRQMHREKHIANLLDLSCQKGQYHSNCHKHGR